MPSCEDKPAPVRTSHQGCDLAQCAAVPIAALVHPTGLSAMLSIVELPQSPVADDFDSAARSPLTPPPIA
jgi:hypothetical protein